jgi:hypothetical protein
MTAFLKDRSETSERPISRSPHRETAMIHPKRVFLLRLISDRSVENDLPTLIPLSNPERVPMACEGLSQTETVTP